MQKLNKQGATFLVHFQILPNICRYSNLKLTLCCRVLELEQEPIVLALFGPTGVRAVKLL